MGGVGDLLKRVAASMVPRHDRGIQNGRRAMNSVHSRHGASLPSVRVERVALTPFYTTLPEPELMRAGHEEVA
jgi:hypothetical protein